MQAGGFPPGIGTIPRDERIIGYTCLLLIAFSLFGVLVKLIVGHFK